MLEFKTSGLVIIVLKPTFHLSLFVVTIILFEFWYCSLTFERENNKFNFHSKYESHSFKHKKSKLKTHPMQYQKFQHYTITHFSIIFQFLNLRYHKFSIVEFNIIF